MVRIKRVSAPSAQSSEHQGPIPLTHHAILELVAPFTRQGRALDLAASERAQRRLRFKPIHHSDQPLPGQALTETLVLECPQAAPFRLQRRVENANGLCSTLEIEGDDAGLLLEQIEAVAVGQQVVVAEGIPIARSYQLTWVDATEQHPAHWQRKLVRAEAWVAGVVLTCNAKTGRKMPADLELHAEQDQRLRVPADLFAVLGWEWRPMRELGKRWRGSVRISAVEPARTGDIERKLSQAVTHLARTLRSHPGDFHSQWQAARWRVTFQRAIPMLTGLALLAVTPLVQLLSLDNASLARMFIFHAPPMLLMGIFMMRELPVIEIPPVPRRLIGGDWIIDERKGPVSDPATQGAEAG
jgi:hypothetical protein